MRTSFSTSTAAERSHTHTPSSRPEWILLRASEATPPRQTTTPGREFARISLQNSRADPAWREHARFVAVAEHAWRAPEG